MKQKRKRILSVLLCGCILCGLMPSQAMAVNQTEEPPIEEQTNSIGELGGYLAGNAMTAAKLFAERKFTASGGTGFAAERGNNLVDRMKGLNASVVGDDNAANGPDRKIINRAGSITWIQDKYYPTARRSVNAAFNEAGQYRYFDGNGQPMQLEVPSDQYDDAVLAMREKIRKGQVSGVSDPDEAVNLIRKGNLSYEQAKNIAKAGTVDSLKYDAANGVITAGCAAGIGFVIDFTCCMLNGAETEDALKNAGLNGLKTGGVVFATYVISSQLAKTGLANALVPTTEAIANALGKKVCEAIVQKSGVQTAGASATTHAAVQIISRELIADGVLLVVLTGVDVAELFRGRISKEELLKNLTVTIVSVAAGTAGGYGGATLGSLVAPGFGSTVGAILGSVAAGGLSALLAEKLIAPYYKSDAEEMFEIIRDEFTELCGAYLINEEEGGRIADRLSSVLTGNALKDMYAPKIGMHLPGLFWSRCSLKSPASAKRSLPHLKKSFGWR